jgi:general secretion pathway protein A
MEGTGIVVLTGGIGTGKTTLLRFLMGKIERAMDVAVVFNTNVTGEELLRLIIREFEAGEPGPDKAANLAMLNDFLIDRFRQGRQAIVIIDEAQNLSREALEEVRLLSNLQGSRRPLLQLVLAGQPELRRKLADPALTQLAQRITSTFHLAPLDADETRQYVRFRLTQAGGSPDLFEDAAVDAVHRASGGVPRVINILCNNALVHAFADALPAVTAEVVGGVVEEAGSMFQPAGDQPDEAPEAPPAETPSLEMAVRVGTLEDRVRTVEEKLAARNTEIQILQFEIAALKDRLAARQEAAPRPAVIPERTPVPEVRPVQAAQPPSPGFFGRAVRALFGGEG